MQIPPLSAGLPQIPDSVRFAAALGQFSRSMQHFSNLHEQTSTRLSKVIRMGMIALATLFIAVFLMLLIMAQRINLMVDNIASINTHFHHMVPDISKMHSNMIKMHENIISIEAIPNEMTQMLSSMDDMHSQLQKMHTHIATMSGQTEHIAQQTEVMTNQMHAIATPITLMQKDIQQAARPIHLMNKMMPGR
jgi:predicted PurR-regulated permease PerM